MDQKVDLKHYELFIDGKHVAPTTGEYTIDLDPATEEPIAEVAQGGKADVDKAVSAARAACGRTGPHIAACGQLVGTESRRAHRNRKSGCRQASRRRAPPGHGGGH